jgi:dimethylglycine dehydrogenase
VTDKGSLVAEHVINAGGLWAREVDRWAGAADPGMGTAVITGEIPGIAPRRKCCT